MENYKCEYIRHMDYFSGKWQGCELHEYNTQNCNTLRLQTISVGNQIQSVTKPKTLHIHIFSWTAAKLTALN